VSHWLLVCLAKEEPLACDTLVVDAATAAPDADFSSPTEREHERLEPSMVDVLTSTSGAVAGRRCRNAVGERKRGLESHRRTSHVPPEQRRS
jgi:hypothetical protein